MSPSAIAVIVLAQTVSAGQVGGTVREDSTLVPVADVVVRVVELGRVTVSDGRGAFALGELPAGSWTVRASAIGYDSTDVEVVVRGGTTTTLDLHLRSAPIRLPGLNVEVLRRPSTGPVGVRADMETLALVPALAEVDVLRALDVLPAVATVSEYSAALYVRGGTPDQTDLLLDGFPVFNPYHLGGLYAAFNPDAVATVEVVPGAMPAALGSRITSAVSVTTREGGQDRIRGRGTVSLSSLGVALDGPVPHAPGTFLLSGRRSLRNLTGGGIAGEGIVPRTLDTHFDDVLAKWTLPWPGGAVEGLYFSTREWVGLPDVGRGSALSPALRHDWRWGSRLLGLASHLPLGPSARLEVRIGSSTFETRLGTWWQVLGRRGDEAVRARGAMADRLAKAEIVAGSGRHRVRMGGELRRSTMDYDSKRSADPPGGLWNDFVPLFLDAFRVDVAQLWLEDEVTVTNALGLRLGVRATGASGLGTVVQPRAGVRLTVAEGVVLTAGAGRYAQPVHSVRVEEAVGTSFMAFDLFRPASRELAMPTAEDAVVGAELRKGPATVRVDAWAKRYPRLVLPRPPLDPWHAPVLELDSLYAATGEARGLEILADWMREPAGVWLSWAWQESLRTVQGVSYAPRFERRHTLDLLTSFALPDGLSASVRAVWASGQPTTPVTGRFQPPRFAAHLDRFDVRAERRSLLGGHNTSRLPAYLRVDLGARLDVEREVLGRATELRFFAHLLNALNITNTLYWDPSSRIGADDDPTWQFPPTLTAGLDWSF